MKSHTGCQFGAAFEEKRLPVDAGLVPVYSLLLTLFRHHTEHCVREVTRPATIKNMYPISPSLAMSLMEIIFTSFMMPLYNIVYYM